MIGIDTNILVRYIVQDDERQALLAAQLLEEGLGDKNKGLVGAVVLCELVWVLRRAYGYEKVQVCNVLRMILASADLVVDRLDDAQRALREYEQGNADFSDYFIGQMNRTLKAKATYTLDQKAGKGKHFTLLEK
jgi:predicted nucleic-acid-binding protein